MISQERGFNLHLPSNDVFTHDDLYEQHQSIRFVNVIESDSPKFNPFPHSIQPLCRMVDTLTNPRRRGLPHKIAGQTSPSIHPPIGNSYAPRDFLP